LLQQDASRLVLKSKPSDRFAIFSQLLGLSDLERFEDWTQARAREATALHRSASEALTGAERAAVAARDQLSKALERASQRPAVEAVAGRLSQTITACRSLEATLPANRDEAVALSAASTRLGQELESLAVTIAAVVEVEGSIPDGASRRLDEEIAAADTAAQGLELRLESQREALVSARAAHDAAMAAQQGLQRMAAAVLSQLAGSTCPVCGQGIDINEVRRHMEELAGDTGAVDRLHAAITDLEAQFEQTGVELAASRSLANNLRAEAGRRARHEQEVAYLRQRLGTLQTTGLIGTAAPPAAFQELVTWVRSTRSEIALVGGVTQEYIAAIDASGGAEEVRATQAVSSTEATLRGLEAARQSAELARKEAETLHEVAQASRLDVVRSEFARLAPLAQNVFSRLDPHPTFTELELKTDVLRSASTATAQVRDVLQDVSADPMVIFSSAQANIAAISYLISLNWAAAGRVPVLMLDDPLQAMDDINVLGFADLCRHLRIKRQVVVSTHESRFAQLLERKLTPRNDGDRTIVHEFVGWARSGPLVKTRSA
jgi:DNA repair exonuclease SbcCD ATPase subunit